MTGDRRRDWPTAKRPDRTFRIMPRRVLSPADEHLRQLIAECFEVQPSLIVTEVELAMIGVRCGTPSDACLIGPKGPRATRKG